MNDRVLVTYEVFGDGHKTIFTPYNGIDNIVKTQYGVQVNYVDQSEMLIPWSRVWSVVTS